MHSLMLIFFIYRLTFQKDLLMLSSRSGLMLKRPSYIWMVYDFVIFPIPEIFVFLFACNPIFIYHILQAQVDGKVVRAKFTLPERKKVASPPKGVATASRRDGSKTDDAAADGDKDGAKRPREGEIFGEYKWIVICIYFCSALLFKQNLHHIISVSSPETTLSTSAEVSCSTKRIPQTGPRFSTTPSQS